MKSKTNLYIDFSTIKYELNQIKQIIKNIF